jgi:transaldolase
MILLDNADIEEIHIAARWGVLDGVITNPTLSPTWAEATTKSPPRSARSRPGR